VVRPSFLPLHREERLVIADVSWELLASLLHEALVALGDEEAALHVTVMAAVLVGDESRSGREELDIREGLDIGEVQLALWAPESPGGRVLRVANSGVLYVPRVSRKPPVQIFD
jgi:hypothetical protein